MALSFLVRGPGLYRGLVASGKRVANEATSSFATSSTLVETAFENSSLRLILLMVDIRHLELTCTWGNNAIQFVIAVIH
ncbi:hypothetical protein BGX38DRAFT_1189015 [Terfezia claveryi]|nr:hypothetical protein BGX38DRAFT_1189015 [Terfezia claveryi]